MLDELEELDLHVQVNLGLFQGFSSVLSIYL